MTTTDLIEQHVHAYFGSRSAEARFTSFDYCFNYFQSYRDSPVQLAAPEQIQTSCLQLGFYLASWGMLRGSAELLRKSARHFIPLIEEIAQAPRELWDLDVNGYDNLGIASLIDASKRVRLALRPVNASDILVTKTLLGVYGNVPAFDTYFKKGFGVSTYSHGSLARVGHFYNENAELIDRLRQPTLSFDSGQPTSLLYTRAKVIDMIFFMAGGYV